MIILDKLQIRKFNNYEYENALSLVWKVFQVYEAPDYSQEGIDEFYKSIYNPTYLACVPHMVSANSGMSDDKARNMMAEFFPKLERWKKG